MQPKNFRKPKIKILAVESEIYEVPPWDQFKHVIWEALVDVEEVDIKRIITALEEKVMKRYGVAPETARGLHLLRGIIDGMMKTCHLCMHCEAVFAALLEARHRVQLNSFTNTDKATELKRLDDNFKVLDIVS